MFQVGDRVELVRSFLSRGWRQGDIAIIVERLSSIHVMIVDEKTQSRRSKFHISHLMMREDLITPEMIESAKIELDNLLKENNMGAQGRFDSERPKTFSDLLEAVLTILPDAEIGEDNEGQLVIHTGVMISPGSSAESSGERLVEFQ